MIDGGIFWDHARMHAQFNFVIDVRRDAEQLDAIT